MAQMSLQAYVDNPTITGRFVDILGKEGAEKFKAALINIYNGNKQLQQCDVRSIVGAAGLSAMLNLSITPSLGQAYIVPFRGSATFQIGTKGLIQLAHRTGKYVALHAGKICEGELRGFNPITGEPVTGEKISDEVIGYVAYMRLNNGFEKTLYMTLAEIEAHAEKYSQSYSYDKKNNRQSSPWSTNFDAMASKTVLKKLLNTWGILSTDMASAIQADQSVVDKNTFAYVDNGGTIQRREGLYVPEEGLTVDADTGEVIEAKAEEVQS